MTLDLPKPIAAYFAADSADSEAVSQCFTENALVKDEGHTYQGRAAIKNWKADVSTKFQYTSAPFACERKDGRMVVTSRLTGNFPGSPVNLRFFFELEATRSRRWKSSVSAARRRKEDAHVRHLRHTRCSNDPLSALKIGDMPEPAMREDGCA